ncbi:MAG: PEP/pyruvate-binding domain-containing protein [Polyangiaceae bacterium]
MRSIAPWGWLLLAVTAAVGCGDDTQPPPGWACTLESGSDPDSAAQLGCRADYDIVSSEPTDASIPGATSVKTIIDRADDEHLYFQNSKRYCIHWDFAHTHLSGGDRPIVPELSQFNATEYYSPDRRFLLGALSYYEGPDKWVYEISPYDTADADMITTAFRKIRDNVWIGADLTFHPTSQSVEAVAKDLPSDVPVTTTDDLYAGVDYQPLNMGTSTGILRFHTAAEVDGQYTPYREIVVLDAVPNDISIVSGIITSEFQTPLAHINVLSVNRGTPNMALRDAVNDPDLLALEGKWVELKVEPFGWTVREITQEEADAWWEAHKPDPISVQPMNLTVEDLPAARDLVDLDTMNLKDAIATAIPAFGAKATNYGALARAQESGAFDTLPDIDGDGPIQPGFGVPMFYYDQFMKDNGLYDRITELMAGPNWSDPVYRADALLAFKDELRAAPMRPEVVAAVVARAAELFPGEKIRFRSSTNSEDLGKFTGAGLYDSETGDPSVTPGDKDSVEWAMKKVWSQVWNPRAYEERDYYSMDHLSVGMGLLVHANFPQEEAQGVAITNNPFDTSGLEPAFYVNGQIGNNDVVTPDLGVYPDAYLQYFYTPGQPIVYIQHSNLVEPGQTVLTTEQAYRLGVALDAIHQYFFAAYGSVNDWYALEVDWKFDDKLTPGSPQLFIKQVRPYPGWNTEPSAACGGAQ